MIKLGISNGLTHFDGLRRRIVSLTPKSKIEGRFKESEKDETRIF
jgi:hypothetical protein